MTDLESIAQFVLQKARERGVFKSTCPSEIAREFPQGWRSHMAEIRQAAIVLHKSGKVLITRKGKAVDPDHIKEPIRIKIKSS